jgi:CHAT domain-containing protein
MFAFLREKRGLQPRPSATEGLLALGDPLFDDPQQEPPAARADTPRRLIGTRREVLGLAELFTSAGISAAPALLDSEASQQQLLELNAAGELKRYRYLHLATHGEIDVARPMRSRLLLSRDQLPDPYDRARQGQPPLQGELTAEAILKTWKLDAELVTLSACQTGLGRPSDGEGYLGFAQALLLAGARSMVLSLWEVDDRATSLLMCRFYANLLGKRDGLEQPLAKSEALAEAKRWLRELPLSEVSKLTDKLDEHAQRGKGRVARPAAEDPRAPMKSLAEQRPFAHPYYWAAFILIGDPQ